MTKAITLDRSKPFGTIHGRLEDRPTAVFEQNGFLFDGAGNVVLSKDEKARQKKELEDQLAALNATKTTEPAPPADPADEAEPGLVEVRDGVTGDVDLKPAKEEAKPAKTTSKNAGGKNLALPKVED